MTVSRALSDHPNVQADTREAVLRHAREQGYVRNAAARVIRGGATQIVGLLLPNIVNEFYARFANAMARNCDAAGLQLLIHLTNDDGHAEAQALTRLREVQARAVVMVPVPGPEEGADSAGEDVPVIQLIRRRAGTVPRSAVLVNDAPAILAAVRHLAWLGHGRIGYIGAPSDLSSGRMRLAGFEAGLRAAGLPRLEALIRVGEPSFAMGRTEAADLLRAGDATAIICGGIEISNGALSAFMDHGDMDFGFVGYGDPSFYSWINGGISTIHVPVDELAQAAIALATEEASGEIERVFDARLIVRGQA